jgi:hypothetical protein
MTLRDIDMRPHPLGIAYHPEWSAVRERLAERICNWHQRQVIEAEEAARRVARSERRPISGRAIRITVQFAAVSLFLGAFWAFCLGVSA